MGLLVNLVGGLIAFAGAWMLWRPGDLLTLAGRIEEGTVRYSAALLRLLVGALLLAAAATARYPLIIEVIGWLAALSGLLLVALPPALMHRIAGLATLLNATGVRALSVPVFLFAGFLVYNFT